MDGSYVQEDGDGNVSCDMYTSCDASKVEDRFLSGLTVVPNPSKGMVTVTLPAGFELRRMQWFDAMGRELGSEFTTGLSRELDLSAWGTGVRYLTVTTVNGWTTTRRIVVQ